MCCKLTNSLPVQQNWSSWTTFFNLTKKLFVWFVWQQITTEKLKYTSSDFRDNWPNLVLAFWLHEVCISSHGLTIQKILAARIRKVAAPLFWLCSFMHLHKQTRSLPHCRIQTHSCLIQSSDSFSYQLLLCKVFRLVSKSVKTTSINLGCSLHRSETAGIYTCLSQGPGGDVHFWLHAFANLSAWLFTQYLQHAFSQNVYLFIGFQALQTEEEERR